MVSPRHIHRLEIIELASYYIYIHTQFSLLLDKTKKEYGKSEI